MKTKNLSWQGRARLGMARLGMARLGMAGQGMAGHGTVMGPCIITGVYF
jgi:hypothetical protein